MTHRTRSTICVVLLALAVFASGAVAQATGEIDQLAPGTYPGDRDPGGAGSVGKAFVEFVSGPTAAGDAVVVRARVTGATALHGRLLLPDGVHEAAAATVAVAAGRRIPVTLTMHLEDAGRAALADSGVLRVTLVLEALTNGAESGRLTRSTALVSRPELHFRRTGRSRTGGFGGQLLRGTSRGDLLEGDSGNDELFGRGGGDKLLGGTGNDTLHGGSGADLIDGDDGDDVLLGGPGDDQLVEARFGRDTIDGGAGDDWIDGARGVDHLLGGPGDDVILGGPGHDHIDCGPGDDVALVNLQSERRDLHGCETVLDEPDFPIIPCDEGGTSAPETLLGTDGPDTCEAFGGNDDVEGAGGDDRLFGGDGDDRIFGRFGDDLLVGDAGDDEIEGGRGKDTLRGGSGDDALNGGYDADRVFGGPGDDRIIARGGGSDRVDCGPGHDVVFVDSRDHVAGCEDVHTTR